MGELKPVWEGYLADPFVLRTAGGYYAYGTDGPGREIISTTGLHFPVLYSPDLQAWELVGGAVRSEAKEQHFWAPEVMERDGRFYLFYSRGGEQGQDHAIYLAIADTPAGPFVETGPALMPDLKFSIDASPFRDPSSGETLLFFARDFLNSPIGTGLAVVRLGSDMRPSGPPKTILRASADWHVFEENRYWYGKTWRRWNTLEGPGVLFRNRVYYLFYSGGNWQTSGYGVSYITAQRAEGPYLGQDREQGANLVKSGMAGLNGPGHSSLFEAADGRHFITFHAWDQQASKRQMYVAPLRWETTDEGERPRVIL